MRYIFLLSFIVGFVFSEAAVAISCDQATDQEERRACTSSPSNSTGRARSPTKRNTPSKSTSKQNRNQGPNVNDLDGCKPEGQDALTKCDGRGWNPEYCRCRTAAEAELYKSVSPQNPPGEDNTEDTKKVETAVRDCATARDEAMSSCDKNEDGLQGAESTLSTFATQAGAMGLGACTKLAPAMAGANAAVVAFKTRCSNKREDCMKTCDQSGKAISNMPGMNAESLAKKQGLIEDDYNSCKKLSGNIAEATQAIQNIATAIPGVANCIKATTTDPALLDYCTNNPGAIGCTVAATDCSNPAIAAVNPICICKNNPTASMCTGAQAKADFGSTGGSASMTGGAGGAGGGSIDSDNPFSNLGWGGNGMEPSKGGAEDPGGKKGGGANLGDGGGGAPGGGDGKGGGAAAAALAVNNGFRGGGGGGGGWGGGNYGGGSDEGRAYGDPKNPASGDPNNPNLRDFLPNGKLNPAMANRGLAGISGPDGITGPHSDIWKKVQNRYRVQVEGSKLMP